MKHADQSALFGLTSSSGVSCPDYICCVVDLTLETFPADFDDRRVIYWHGVDTENRKICTLCCVSFFATCRYS